MKKTLAILLAALMLFMIGCGGEKKAETNQNAASIADKAAEPTEAPTAEPTAEPTPEPTPDPLEERAGVYKAVSLYSDEEGDMTDQLAMLESMGMVITLELNDDGTGVMSMLGEDQELEWDERYITIDDYPNEYVYEEETISLDDDGSTMVFERISREELDEIRERSAGSDFLAGDKEDGSLIGEFHVTSCSQDGQEVSMDDEVIVLYEDGTGAFGFGSPSYLFDWELSGTRFTFTDEEGDGFVGTWIGSVIEGDYTWDLPDGVSTFHYVFEGGENSSVSSGGAPTVGASVGGAKAGVYKLVYLFGEGVDDNEIESTLALMESFGMKMTLTLNADGSGQLYLIEETFDLKWDASCLTVEGTKIPYTYDGSRISITFEDEGMIFEWDA